MRENSTDFEEKNWESYMKRQRNGMVREEVEREERNEKTHKKNLGAHDALQDPSKGDWKDLERIKERERQREKNRRQENNYTQKILNSREKSPERKLHKSIFPIT